MSRPETMSLQAPPPPAAWSAQSPAPGAAAATLDSAALLQGGRAVMISHNGELYRLQSTRQGKLILTK